MGIFSKLFGDSNALPVEEKVLPWIFLTNEAQLERIKKDSFQKVQVIFKHSTGCGISSMVMNKFVKNFNLDVMAVDLYYLDLLSYRSVSDAVAFQFQVVHQSPQLLIIKDGEVVHSASHYDIDANRISDFI